MLEELKSYLEVQGNVTSVKSRKNQETEHEHRGREYQRTASDSQNEVRKRKNELTEQIIKDLRDIIIVIAGDEQHDLILNDNPALTIFADEGLDITDRVINKCNEPKGKDTDK